ncbi:MAG: magnesium transporter [Candidatus Bathycorpusculaceae bacterium]
MKPYNTLQRNCISSTLPSANSPTPLCTLISAVHKNSSGFKQEFSIALRQSLMAYVFNLAGIAAGATVAYYVGVFQLFPWAFAVYPPILSARGVIGGLFCGRLSTGLHLGTVQARFFGNTRSFYLLFHAIVVLTFEASVFMSLISILFTRFYGEATTEFLKILVVMMATMALALVIISPLTLAVSFLSFKYGLDPDIVLYPIESTVADLLITIIYIGVLNIFAFAGFAGQYMLAFTGLVLILCASYFLVRNFRETEFLKTIRESFLMVIFVSIIINIAGSTLGKIAEVVGERREIYTVYPALIDTIGDVGAVVGSTATTKLALGTLKSSLSSIKDHNVEISGAWAASLIMYCIYSVLALAIQGVFTLPNLLNFTALLIIANIMAASCIILISYAVAILTYQRGLDPDNFGIPIESSLADSITSIALLAALLLVRF